MTALISNQDLTTLLLYILLLGEISVLSFVIISNCTQDSNGQLFAKLCLMAFWIAATVNLLYRSENSNQWLVVLPAALLLINATQLCRYWRLLPTLHSNRLEGIVTLLLFGFLQSYRQPHSKLAG